MTTGHKSVPRPVKDEVGGVLSLHLFKDMGEAVWQRKNIYWR